MARSNDTYTGNGSQTAYTINFPYINQDHVHVYLNGVETFDFTWTSASQITFDTAPAADVAIYIQRLTSPGARLVDYEVPGNLSEEDLDTDSLQAFYLSQEASDIAVRAMNIDPADDKFDAQSKIIKDVADPVDAQDAATKAYGDANWGGSAATAAAASASAASTSATSASNSATAAAGSASDAADALAATQALVDAVGFSDVVFLTAANSPYTVTQADAGKLLSFDTSGGNVVVNLSTISTLSLPFTTGIKKTTGDANTITVNVGGTDTFDDLSTSKTIRGVAGLTFVPDTDSAPDKWSTAEWGAITAQVKKQRFQAGVDYIKNTTASVTVTETPLPGALDTVAIFFDGVYQNEDQVSAYDPVTGVLTFGVAIPVDSVELYWITPLPIGTPADGTVSFPKLDATILASQVEAEAGTATDKLMTPERTAQAIVALRPALKFAKYSYSQAQGVADQAYTTGAWRTVGLTSEDQDTNGIGSLAGNQVTLQAGTYIVRGLVPVYGNNSHAQARIYNATDGAQIGSGNQIRTASTSANAEVEVEFTLASAKAIELQVVVSVNTVAISAMNIAGKPESYAQLMITKIA